MSRSDPPPVDRGAVAGLVAGVSFIGGLAGAIARSEHPYPRPGSSGTEVRRYFRQSSGAPYISVSGQLISAVSLARFTASVARLAQRSARGRRGLTATAIVGGAAASGTLAASALIAYRLARGGDGDADEAVRLARRAFLAGGPVHGVGLALLLAALGAAGARSGELPSSLSNAALAAAPVNALGMLYLLAEPAGWFIPAGRFPGLVIVGIAGTRLSRAR